MCLRTKTFILIEDCAIWVLQVQYGYCMLRVAEETMATVYLIHFNQAFKHARHYIGYTTNLDRRITDHLCGIGARLMEVVTAAGVEWQCVRTWQGDRRLERQLKKRKHAALLCPVCSGERANNRAKF